MKRILLLGVLMVAVACDRLPSVPTFGITRRAAPDIELPFRAKVQASRGNPEFAITVAQGGASLDDVRESVRFPATRRCILQFGSSDVTWDLNAAGDDWAGARDESGQVTYRGRCSGR